MHTNIYIYIYIYMCVCVYICLYVYVYIFVTGRLAKSSFEYKPFSLLQHTQYELSQNICLGVCHNKMYLLAEPPCVTKTWQQSMASRERHWSNIVSLNDHGNPPESRSDLISCHLFLAKGLWITIFTFWMVESLPPQALEVAKFGRQRQSLH